MKRLFVRSLLTFFLPVILLWTFTVELVFGVGDAFYQSWQEVRADIASYRKQMRREDY